MQSTNLLDFITTAHGGLEKWNKWSQIEVTLIIRGNLLAYKGISVLIFPEFLLSKGK